MAYRLIEMILPHKDHEKVKELLEDQEVLGVWEEKLSEEQILVKIFLEQEATESVLDIMEKHFSHTESFRLLLLNVEASLPRPEETGEAKEAKKEKEKARISREELYNDILDQSELTPVYLVQVMLSAVVASIGLFYNNVPIIIGAMIIAPLIGPHMGLSLATTLGDMKLGKQALKTGALGIVIAFLLATGIGFFFEISAQVAEIAQRSQARVAHIFLALASGSAGALSFTTGISTALIGVMIAVALLPPLVALGLLIGSGYYPQAFEALLLVLINVICINLAGVTTFWAQGIHPRKWWKEDRAKKATRIAVLIWFVLLTALASIIVFF